MCPPEKRPAVFPRIAALLLLFCMLPLLFAAGGRSRSGPSPVLAFVLMALGAWNLLAPKSAWWISRGWWYRNAQPSDLALGFYRVTGVLLLGAGLICAQAAL